MAGRRTLEHPWLVALLLVLATLAVYLPVVGFDFTNFDDPPYITGNLQVMEGLTWHGLAWAFAHSCVANWHPITFISHMLDCQLYGLSPGGHHLTNLILHALNSVLLFRLLWLMSGSFWRSSLVAALFAVHPLHVESVAWVAERKDVLSAFFGILCLWAYANFAQEKATRDAEREAQPLVSSQPDPKSIQRARHLILCYALALVLFTLALMSKAMLVTWPGVMLLLDFWPLRRLDGLRFDSSESRRATGKRLGSVFVEKIPFFALALAGSIITFLVVQSWGGVAEASQVPLATRLATVPINYLRYLGKTIWPTDLAAIYPYVRQYPAYETVAAIALLAGGTLLTVWQRNRRAYLLTGWLWFLGTLIPVIGLVQAGNQSIADRFTYLPSIGLFIMATWAAAELVGNIPVRRVLAGFTTAGLLSACAVVSQAQVLTWQNTETLFRHALAVTRNNFVAYGNLGLYFASFREHKEAEHCYRAALAIQSADPFSWNGLAMALINQRRYEEALASCQAALQVDPGMARAQSTMGLALSKLGRAQEALTHYQEALRLDPNVADTHYNLANLLASEGQIQSAREHYAAAARLNPGSADAHNNLGFMLAREGKLDEAEVEFHSTLTLEPSLWQAHYGLADTLARQGKTRDAVQHYRQTIALRPGLVDALNRLAWILATGPDADMRAGDEAVKLAERACQLTQFRQVNLLNTLAAAYAEAGRFEDATNVAQRACLLAQASGQPESMRRTQQLLDLFRSRQSFHETVEKR